MWYSHEHLKLLPLIAMILWGLSTGCGDGKPVKKDVGLRAGGSSQPQNPTISKSPGDPVPKPGKSLYFLLDGFATCPNFSDTEGEIKGTNMTRILDDLKADLKAKSKPDPIFLLSCFTQATGSVYFTTAEFPKFTQYVGVNDFTSKIGQIIAKEANASVHLVGYSYGGWLAMKLAKELELAPGTSLMTLATVDPISATKCQPSDFLGSVSGQSAEGCKQSPADFGADGLATIKSKAKLWSNHYQDEKNYLHSGPVDGAENSDINLAADALLAHVTIVADPTVRKNIVDSLVR